MLTTHKQFPSDVKKNVRGESGLIVQNEFFRTSMKAKIEHRYD